MLICHNPQTWEIKSEIHFSLIPSLIEVVKTNGGKFLIYKNMYINVNMTMANKRNFEKYCYQIQELMGLYNNTINDIAKLSLMYRMTRLVRSAANSLFQYTRFINVECLELPIPVAPLCMESNKALEKVWNESYRDIQISMHEEIKTYF